MFKKFSPSTDIAGQTPVKSSVQRGIRAAVLAQWKIEPETLEAIWPKKEGLVHVKWWASPRILMRSPPDPYILPKVGIDRGAIRFLLAGAPMMCPGLTSKGGYLPSGAEALPAGTAVAIHAEGKEHAVGIGSLKLGTEDIRRINKDVGVELTTYLGDDLWALKSL
ncbi:hypothetical protein H0H87_012729 [Tephrocybe sp. NHM501043]|nr:hypothetical protein H0H87_012729 [Tephrocybe sp. NHM501043]